MYSGDSNKTVIQNEKASKEFVVMPSYVNYVLESIETKAIFGTKECPVYHVLATLLNESFLLQYQP